MRTGLPKCSPSGTWTWRYFYSGCSRCNVRLRWRGQILHGRRAYAVMQVRHVWISFFVVPREFNAGLEADGTKWVQKVQRVAIGTALYCDMDYRVYHMFRPLSRKIYLSVGHVDGVSYMQNYLGLCRYRKSFLMQAVSRNIPFELQLRFRMLFFLEECMRKRS